jgi:electron transfer flavoprotein beta subunit
MKISVCIKQVPDVSAPIHIKDGQVHQDADRLVLDAYSASAVEESIVITEKLGGEVEVVSVGPEKVKETIRKALAMGAGTAVHIETEDGSSFDSLSYAKILAAFYKNSTYDVIAVGKQSQDTDAGLTGGMLAELLGLPYATNAVGLEADADGKKIIVKRQGDSGQEMIELPVPCLVTCSNDMNDPRIPSLKGIMASKKKPVETKTLQDLGLYSVDLSSAMMTEILGYQSLPSREAGKKYEGDATDLVNTLMNVLQNEAKVF